MMLFALESGKCISEGMAHCSFPACGILLILIEFLQCNEWMEIL